MAIVALVSYEHPYWCSAKILAGDKAPEAARYAQEFADSIDISVQWSNDEPYAPFFSLSGGTSDGRSPDGRFTLHQGSLRASYHEIILSRGPNAPDETVLILQEGDPGSGTSHHYQWSHDSKAVFIYGAGTPAGHAYSRELALIYLVDQRALYSINLGQLLSKRIQAMRNAPSQTDTALSPESVVRAAIVAARSEQRAEFVRLCDLAAIASKPRHGMEEKALIELLKSFKVEEVQFDTPLLTKESATITVRMRAPRQLDFDLAASKQSNGVDWMIVAIHP